MRNGVRMSVVIPALLLLMSGCATRDWVRVKELVERAGFRPDLFLVR
jgi:hypothetical protein